METESRTERKHEPCCAEESQVKTSTPHPTSPKLLHNTTVTSYVTVATQTATTPRENGRRSRSHPKLPAKTPAVTVEDFTDREIRRFYKQSDTGVQNRRSNTERNPSPSVSTLRQRAASMEAYSSPKREPLTSRDLFSSQPSVDNGLLTTPTVDEQKSRSKFSPSLGKRLRSKSPFRFFTKKKSDKKSWQICYTVCIPKLYSIMETVDLTFLPLFFPF